MPSFLQACFNVVTEMPSFLAASLWWHLKYSAIAAASRTHARRPNRPCSVPSVSPCLRRGKNRTMCDELPNVEAICAMILRARPHAAFVLYRPCQTQESDEELLLRKSLLLKYPRRHSWNRLVPHGFGKELFRI